MSISYLIFLCSSCKKELGTMKAEYPSDVIWKAFIDKIGNIETTELCSACNTKTEIEVKV